MNGGSVDGRLARSAATRGRLLEAARDEFQRVGFAGARVDAIAASAGANKALIYTYFASKAGLFDAVMADNVTRVEAAVEFTPDDLPGYAVRLLDFWMCDRTTLRLFSWRNVEAERTPDSEDATYREMIAAIASTGIDHTAGIPAAHILAMVFAIVLAWAIPAGVFTSDAPKELAARRASVSAAVERMLRG